MVEKFESVDIEKVEKEVLGTLEKAKRISKLYERVREFEEEQKNLEESIKRDYEQIQKIKKRMRKKNEKLRKVRDEKRKLESEIKEVQKLLRALGVLEKVKKPKKTTSTKQKYIVMIMNGKKVKLKKEFRSLSKCAKYLFDISSYDDFLKISTLDDLVKVFKQHFPYSNIKESKTVMYFYIQSI